MRKIKAILDSPEPPKIITESVKVEYSCPICKTKGIHSFMYIPTKRGRGQKLPNLQTTDRCKYCGKEISCIYQMGIKGNIPKIRKLEMIVDQRIFRGKWVKLLNKVETI